MGPERVAQNFWHITRNVMAREKALYEGHAVAAVAAISKSCRRGSRRADRDRLRGAAARDRCRRGDEAGRAVALRGQITRGIEPAPTRPSNISKRVEFKIGDIDAGFAEADEIVEKEFKTAAVHQAYIEPHACAARFDHDGKAEIWASSQGHFVVRALTAKLLGMPVGDIHVTPAEIGGGFGGKTVVYLEPVAALLAKKSGRPVKIMMSRDEVFKASGPTSGSSMRVKIGVKTRRHDHRRRGRVQIPGRRLPGLAGDERLHVRLCAVQHPEPAYDRLRRRVQSAEIGRLPGAGLADLGFCGRERARHPGKEDRHGPAANCG